MAAERLPIDAFGEATWEMSAEEFGVFTRLLVHLVRRGGNASLDDDRLARVCGVSREQWERVWRVVGSFFVIRAGQLTHPAIDAAIARDAKSARKAQAMAAARWGGKGGGGNGAGGTGGTHTPDDDASSTPPSTAAASAQAFTQASETALVAASAGAFSGGFGGSVSDLDLIPLLPDSEADPDLDLKQDTREPAAIRAVFDHYRAYHPRAHPAPKAGSKEWAKIKARIRGGYSVNDLCLAIDGYHRSSFHTGDNDRGKEYLSLELIVRDDSHVAAGIEFATRPQRRALAPREQRAANTLAACLAEGPPEVPQWMRGITSHS
jgi:uncharacterized protein YdaU (DUF1376 family)